MMHCLRLWCLLVSIRPRLCDIHHSSFPCIQGVTFRVSNPRIFYCFKNADKKDVRIPSHVRIEVGEMSKLDAYVKACNVLKPFKKQRRTEKDDGDDLLEESEDFLHESDQLVCEVCLRKTKNIEKGNRNSVDDEGEEEVCCTCLDCGAHAHLVCLAKSFFECSRSLMCDDKENHSKSETSSDELIPEKGKCPRCDRMQTWGDVLASRARAVKNL